MKIIFDIKRNMIINVQNYNDYNLNIEVLQTCIGNSLNIMHSLFMFEDYINISSISI